MTRTTTLLALVAAIASVAGCDLLGPQRSTARVSEIESSSRYDGGSSALYLREFEYRKDGLIDEITDTAEGDFIQRTELSWNDSNQLEEVTIIDDDSTTIYELEWDQQLLTDIRAYSPDSDGLVRTEISYFNGDARFLEKVVVTTENGAQYSENRTSYGYDESSRVASMKTTAYTEYDYGVGDVVSSETKSDSDMRYDTDTGRLERITLVTEVPVANNNPVAPPAGTDLCADYGWYGDGTCDTSCLYPDPDCGPVDVPAPVDTPDFERSTQLWSMSYGDDGRLDEVLAPGGRLTRLDYDSDTGRVDEIETVDDGYTTRVNYQYEDGAVRAYSFSPSVDFGGFFDVEGGSFGTLQVLSTVGL